MYCIPYHTIPYNTVPYLNLTQNNTILHYISFRYITLPYTYTNVNIYICIIEGSLGVKLPTIWKDGKAEVGRVREEKKGSKKIREKKE